MLFYSGGLLTYSLFLCLILQMGTSKSTAGKRPSQLVAGLCQEPGLVKKLRFLFFLVHLFFFLFFFFFSVTDKCHVWSHKLCAGWCSSFIINLDRGSDSQGRKISQGSPIVCVLGVPVGTSGSLGSPCHTWNFSHQNMSDSRGQWLYVIGSWFPDCRGASAHHSRLPEVPDFLTQWKSTSVHVSTRWGGLVSMLRLLHFSWWLFVYKAGFLVVV